MGKFLKWIKRNMGLFIILLLTLILLIFIIVIFVKMMKGSSEGAYGNRLECTEGNTISSDVYKSVEDEVMATENAVEVSTRLQGKIVYTTIVLKPDISTDRAKEIASATIDNYSEEILGCYDLSFFLKWEGEESDTVITGNKHHKLGSITWVKS